MQVKYQGDDKVAVFGRNTQQKKSVILFTNRKARFFRLFQKYKLLLYVNNTASTQQNGLMKVRTQFNDDEDLALHSLPYLAQIIYLRCIRKYMNYRTKTTGGIENRISLQALRDIGTQTVNRQQQLPTIKAVRVALDQLQRANLIVRVQQCPEDSGRYPDTARTPQVVDGFKSQEKIKKCQSTSEKTHGGSNSQRQMDQEYKNLLGLR